MYVVKTSGAEMGGSVIGIQSKTSPQKVHSWCYICGGLWCFLVLKGGGEIRVNLLWDMGLCWRASG